MKLTSRTRACLSWFLLATAASSAPAASSPPGLQLALETRATQMGVDRGGHLWAWHAGQATVQLIDAEKGLVAKASVPDAGSLDADRTWGIAAISQDGRTLAIVSWDGQVTRRIPLTEVGGAVCWIGAGAVAVSPVMAGHRVEVWNVAEGFQVGTFGVEEAIHPRPGATRLRFVRLQFDPQRQLLYTLDTFTGSLQVFTLDGKLIRNTQLEARPHQGTEQWMKEADAEYRAKNEVFTPTIQLWPEFRVDAEGRAWVVQSCNYESGDTTLRSVTARGSQHEIMMNPQSCCSRNFVLWQNHSLYYRDPMLPKPPCNGAGDWPIPGGSP